MITAWITRVSNYCCLYRVHILLYFLFCSNTSIVSPRLWICYPNFIRLFNEGGFIKTCLQYVISIIQVNLIRWFHPTRLTLWVFIQGDHPLLLWFMLSGCVVVSVPKGWECKDIPVKLNQFCMMLKIYNKQFLVLQWDFS